MRHINQAAVDLLQLPGSRRISLETDCPRLINALETWRKNPDNSTPMLPSQTGIDNIQVSFRQLQSQGQPNTLIFLNDVSTIRDSMQQAKLAALGHLTASIAHEIRNPLAALNHASQLLEESPQIRLAEMRLIHIIQNHAKRMNGIVENILQLSRREQSQPEVMALQYFLPEFAMEFETSKVNHSLDFSFSADTEEAYVMFDKSQLHQCLWKLLDNAADHASRNNMTPKVQLRLLSNEDAGYCVITIADNGPGIKEDQISKIFEPFYSTRKEGSGLGLYIARQLCEANQAELTVDSEPGQGAQFHVRMALAKGMPAEEDEEKEKRRRSYV